MEFFFVLVTLICIVLLLYNMKYHETLALVSKLPGPRGWPIFGNALLFVRKKPVELLEKVSNLAAEYPKFMCVMLGHQPQIMISDPNYAEIFLSSHKLIDKSDEYNLVIDWIQRGLLTSTGKKWFSRRKVITPAFHFKILEKYIEIFDKHSDILVHILKKKNGEPVDIFQSITLCALDNICESVMGIDIQAQINSDSEYVKAVKEISALLIVRMATFYLRPNFIFNITPYKKRQDELLKILHDFTDSVIVNRREELLKSKNEDVDNENNNVGAKRKMIFLDILLHSTIDGKPLTNMDIREEVDTFMFGGHDTTGSGLSFCLYNLAKHPEIQQKAYEEVINVFGNDSTIPITINRLNDLKYLEMVIKESLRLYPSAPVFGRKIKENVQIGEYLIPKGANVAISPYFMSRDPTLWDDPLTFDPERFSSDKKLPHPYLYTPFSAGPRNCIGQKYAMLVMKTTISKVLKFFELSIVPNFELVLTIELVLRPNNGIWLQLKERKTT